MVGSVAVPTNRRADIEGLRAIAIALVLLYHAQIGWFAGGFIGVDVFFVISGFVITTSLIREAEESGQISVFDFYAKRVRRLLPASALTLVATAIGIRLLLPASMWSDFGGDVAAAAAYFLNLRLAARSVDYLAQDVAASPVQHYWSLSVEEQFYLLWPALLLGAVVLATRRKTSVKLAVGLAVLLVVVIPSLVFNLWQTGRSPAMAFFITPTRLWELGVGGLTAAVWHRLSMSPRVQLAAKVAALSLLLWTTATIDASTPWPGWRALVPVVATAVLILAGGRDEDVVERTLGARPFQLMGAWSYSLYLWHWPALAILTARWGSLTLAQSLVLTLLSFVPALLSYYLVENPIRYHRRLVTIPSLSLSIGVTLSLMGVVAGLLIMLQTPRADATLAADELPGARILDQGLTREELLQQLRDTASFYPTAEEATRDRPRLYQEGCQVDQTSPEPVVCEYGDPNGSAVLMVMGDSKAAQYVPAFDDIGRRRGWRVLTVTKSSCALSTRMPAIRGGPYESCVEWGRRALDLVDELRPDVVVVSQGSRQAWDEASQELSTELMRQGMHEAYDRITATGARVVMIRNNVIGDFVVRDCVSANPTDLEECIIPWEDYDSRGSGVLQEQVAAEGGYPIIDPTPLICPQQLCLPVIGGVLLYRDGSHITATYVRSMIPFLEEELLTAAGGRLP